MSNHPLLLSGTVIPGDLARIDHHQVNREIIFAGGYNRAGVLDRGGFHESRESANNEDFGRTISQYIQCLAFATNFMPDPADISVSRNEI